jgi:hypothetical protein
MSRPRTLLVGLAVWCGVVAAVSTLVWVVIGRAGAGVLPDASPQPAVTGSLPVPHERSGPGLHTSPGTVLSPRTSAPTTPPSSRSSTSSSTTPSSPSTTRPAAPVAQRRSWSGTAGHVVAQCRGTAARLVSAYPNAGFRYQVLARGPLEVRVRFLRIGEDHGITVTARCLAGVPHFSTTGHEPGDD